LNDKQHSLVGDIPKLRRVIFLPRKLPPPIGAKLVVRDRSLDPSNGLFIPKYVDEK
jgi:hypothetical protein